MHIFLLLLLLRTVHGAFRPSNLEGLYVFSIGKSSCPLTIQFPPPPSDSTISPSSILINESKCESGRVRLADTPGATNAETPGELLARYLSGERNAGGYLVATVEDDLRCPDRDFPEEIAFVFIKADDDFEVSWTEVFEDNDTWLEQNGGGDEYRFEEDEEIMIVASECLYKRRDIPEESRRACFPGSAWVTTKEGERIRMDELRAGTEVNTVQGVSKVFSFSHRNMEYMRAIRLITEQGVLEASAGHYVYIDGTLQCMREAQVGMSLEYGNDTVTINRVETVISRGMYNPHTVSGELLVNGFRVSCYTEAVSPPAAHGLLAPVRAGMRLFGMTIANNLISAVSNRLHQAG